MSSRSQEVRYNPVKIHTDFCNKRQLLLCARAATQCIGQGSATGFSLMLRSRMGRGFNRSSLARLQQLVYFEISEFLIKTNQEESELLI